jgi:lantibiotic modifying enzyme
MRTLLLTSTLVLALAAAPASQAPAPSTLREAAIDAAKWIRASGVKTGNGLVWPADPNDPKSIDTSLYTGTPGVVLFLLELHRATGNDEYLRDARAGADHLLGRVESAPLAGLYTGVGGIGYTLGEVHRATKDEKYAAGVRRVIARLGETAKTVGSGVEWSEVTDVIGGTAGTGLFLVHQSRTLPSQDALALAARAGRRLLDLAKPEAGGSKWAMSPGRARLMPNFSHGTAGIAYFLADLYAATKDNAFLDGALAGARYLKAVAKTEGDMCLIFHHEPDVDGKNLFYLGYCHGPAGTARLWYKLYQVTGDKEWLQWTERSARGILTSGIPERQTPGFWNNVSQCCGSAGVAAFFLSLHEATRKSEYLAFSQTVTSDLLARATRDANGTRWVQAEHRVKPELLVAQTGWMQGASGIGAWLLQLEGHLERRKPLITLPDNPF